MRYCIISLFFICLLMLSCNQSTERLKDFEVHGIDVSHYQEEINWDTVAAQQIDFAFIKATEGKKLVDNCFEQNWQELKKVGIKRGAYHFFHPTLSSEIQATNFIATVQMDFGDLPPVLDFEVTNNVRKKELILRIQSWLDLIEAHYKIRPIIYTNQKLYFQYILNNFNDYPIWIARYNSIRPLMLRENGWQFWQYGNKGTIKGIEGLVDLNVFCGDLLKLEEMGLSPETAISNIMARQ